MTEALFFTYLFYAIIFFCLLSIALGFLEAILIMINNLSRKFPPDVFFDWVEKKVNARRMLRAKLAVLTPYRSSGMPLDHELPWTVSEPLRCHLTRCVTYLPFIALWNWYKSTQNNATFGQGVLVFGIVYFVVVFFSSIVWVIDTFYRKVATSSGGPR